MNLPAFRLFIDLLAGEGGHGGIEAPGAVAGKLVASIVTPCVTRSRNLMLGFHHK